MIGFVQLICLVLNGAFDVSARHGNWIVLHFFCSFRSINQTHHCWKALKVNTNQLNYRTLSVFFYDLQWTITFLNVRCAQWSSVIWIAHFQGDHIHSGALRSFDISHYLTHSIDDVLITAKCDSHDENVLYRISERRISGNWQFSSIFYLALMSVIHITPFIIVDDCLIATENVCTYARANVNLN